MDEAQHGGRFAGWCVVERRKWPVQFTSELMDNSLKDKVLEAVDIVAVIGERLTLTRQGREFVGLCPFHPDHRPSLSVSPQKQIFKCWSCGAGGDVIRFVELYDHVDFREALATLARRAGIELRSAASDQRSNQLREQLLAVTSWARKHFQDNLHTSPAGRAALDYAKRRGLTPETVQRFGLGLALDGNDNLLRAAMAAKFRPENLQQAGLVATSDRGSTYDRFRNRLMFPIADSQGRSIAFGGRTLGDDRAKYLNSPETPLFSKSRVLYALDLARRPIDEANAVIIVEGYMDAVLLHQYGFMNVVATLGTALTDAHVKMLRPRAATIYLCFDGDAAGVRAADRGVEVALRTQADVRVVLLHGSKDPADCVVEYGADEFQRHLKDALDALEFKWRQTLSAFGRGGQTTKRAAIEQYLQFVAGAALGGGLDPLQQNLLTGRLSELLGVPAEAVFDMLAAAKTAARRPGATPMAGEPVSGASRYEESIRGLPAGLVTAVETVLGLLVTDPVCWCAVDDNLPQGVDFSRTWQGLYTLLLDVHHDIGQYSVRDIVARCQDSALCELVGRARARVAGVASASDDCVAASRRLASELSVIRMGGLREELRPAGTDGDSEEGVFRSLLDMARSQHSVLPAEARWNSTPSAP